MSNNQKLEVFCVNDPGKECYVSHYHLPDGRTVHRSEDGKTIDFEPLRLYIGQTFTMFTNGAPDYEAELSDVTITDEGVPTILFQPLLPMSEQ